MKRLFFFHCVYFVHFDYIAYLNKEQIFFTAKMKLMHIHASELACGKFEVLAVICQLYYQRRPTA